MSVGFDNLPINRGLLMGLPFREGAGIITRDEAKPGRVLTLNDPGGGSFAWGNLATGIPYLQFVAIGGGATDGVYLSCPAAETLDMDFTNDDYSLGGWFNWDSTGGFSEILMGRYGTELDGWDIYMNISGGLNTLSHRHHHSSHGAGDLKSECFSTGWTPLEWHFFGVSRYAGSLYPVHYRNASPLVMAYDGTGMRDPDTCNRDLVLGCRNTKDANWYRNMMWNMRVWNRTLMPAEWGFILNAEGHWFGAN